MKLGNFTDFLRQSDDIEQRDRKGRTALFRVARIGKSEFVRVLLDCGADPNAEDSSGEAPLQVASRYGHLECVEMLITAGARLDHCPPPETTEYSETALCSAARKQPEIAKILLRHGANPNAASSARRLPLIHAAEAENSHDTLIALLEAGARVNERDKQGRTALHAAIDAGSIPLIKTLLQHGADPEIETPHAGTALCAAILNFEADIPALVLALLPARPNLAAVCPSWGMIPVELASEFELPDVVELLLAAGSPRPRPSDTSSTDSTTSVIETSEGRVKVTVRVESGSSEPSPDDRALARDICGKPAALCQRFGWRSSPHHWRILKGLDSQKDPIPLSRIAYFVRGHLNAPAGKELEDGSQLLGHSYQEAVSIMVDEGLVVQAADDEALALSASASELNRIAKSNGIQTTGTKKILLERLIAHLGIQHVKQQVHAAGHFRITPEGSRMLDNRERHLAETSNKLRKELLGLLADHEFVWACHIGCGLWQILGRGISRHGVVHEDCFASCIAKARAALEAPIPSELQFLDTMGKRLRSISAAVSLLGDQDNDWSHWDPTLGEIFSPDGDPISPSGFRNLLLIGLDE